MQIFKSSVVACCVLFVTGSAQAQQAPKMPHDAVDRGYVSVGTGATFGTERAPAFSVEYGDQMGRHVQAYATFSYFDNIITDATRDELQSLGAMMAGLTGTRWDFQGRDRGTAFLAGAKFLVPTGTAVRPYVGAGAGAIQVKRTITERTRGDLTSAIATDLGFTDGAFNTADASATKPIVEGIVGLGFVAGHTYVDVGYRYRKAFHFSTPLDFGQFSIGVGYRF